MTTPSLRDGLGKSVGQGEVSGGLGRGRVLRGEEPAGEELRATGPTGPSPLHSKTLPGIGRGRGGIVGGGEGGGLAGGGGIPNLRPTPVIPAKTQSSTSTSSYHKKKENAGAAVEEGKVDLASIFHDVDPTKDFYGFDGLARSMEKLQMDVLKLTREHKEDEAEEKVKGLESLSEIKTHLNNPKLMERLGLLFDAFQPWKPSSVQDLQAEWKAIVQVDKEDNEYWSWLTKNNKSIMLKLDGCLLIRKFFHRAGISPGNAIDILRIYLYTKYTEHINNNNRSSNDNSNNNKAEMEADMNFFDTCRFMEDSFVDELVESYHVELNNIEIILNYIVPYVYTSNQGPGDPHNIGGDTLYSECKNIYIKLLNAAKQNKNENEYKLDHGIDWDQKTSHLDIGKGLIRLLLSQIDKLYRSLPPPPYSPYSSFEDEYRRYKYSPIEKIISYSSSGQRPTEADRREKLQNLVKNRDIDSLHLNDYSIGFNIQRSNTVLLEAEDNQAKWCEQNIELLDKVIDCLNILLGPFVASVMKEAEQAGHTQSIISDPIFTDISHCMEKINKGRFDTLTANEYMENEEFSKIQKKILLLEKYSMGRDVPKVRMNVGLNTKLQNLPSKVFLTLFASYCVVVLERELQLQGKVMGGEVELQGEVLALKGISERFNMNEIFASQQQLLQQQQQDKRQLQLQKDQQQLKQNESKQQPQQQDQQLTQQEQEILDMIVYTILPKLTKLFYQVQPSGTHFIDKFGFAYPNEQEIETWEKFQYHHFIAVKALPLMPRMGIPPLDCDHDWHYEEVDYKEKVVLHCDTNPNAQYFYKEMTLQFFVWFFETIKPEYVKPYEINLIMARNALSSVLHYDEYKIFCSTPKLEFCINDDNIILLFMDQMGQISEEFSARNCLEEMMKIQICSARLTPGELQTLDMNKNKVSRLEAFSQDQDVDFIYLPSDVAPSVVLPINIEEKTRAGRQNKKVTWRLNAGQLFFSQLFFYIQELNRFTIADILKPPNKKMKQEIENSIIFHFGFTSASKTLRSNSSSMTSISRQSSWKRFRKPFLLVRILLDQLSHWSSISLSQVWQLCNSWGCCNGVNISDMFCHSIKLLLSACNKGMESISVAEDHKRDLLLGMHSSALNLLFRLAPSSALLNSKTDFFSQKGNNCGKWYNSILFCLQERLSATMGSSISLSGPFLHPKSKETFLAKATNPEGRNILQNGIVYIDNQTSIFQAFAKNVNRYESKINTYPITGQLVAFISKFIYLIRFDRGDQAAPVIKSPNEFNLPIISLIEYSISILRNIKSWVFYQQAERWMITFHCLNALICFLAPTLQTEAISSGSIFYVDENLHSYQQFLLYRLRHDVGLIRILLSAMSVMSSIPIYHSMNNKVKTKKQNATSLLNSKKYLDSNQFALPLPFLNDEKPFSHEQKPLEMMTKASLKLLYMIIKDRLDIVSMPYMVLESERVASSSHDVNLKSVKREKEKNSVDLGEDALSILLSSVEPPFPLFNPLERDVPIKYVLIIANLVFYKEKDAQFGVEYDFNTAATDNTVLSASCSSFSQEPSISISSQAIQLLASVENYFRLVEQDKVIHLHKREMQNNKYKHLENNIEYIGLQNAYKLRHNLVKDLLDKKKELEEDQNTRSSIGRKILIVKFFTELLVHGSPLASIMILSDEEEDVIDFKKIPQKPRTQGTTKNKNGTVNTGESTLTMLNETLLALQQDRGGWLKQVLSSAFSVEKQQQQQQQLTTSSQSSKNMNTIIEEQKVAYNERDQHLFLHEIFRFIRLLAETSPYRTFLFSNNNAQNGREVLWQNLLLPLASESGKSNRERSGKEDTPALAAESPIFQDTEENIQELKCIALHTSHHIFRTLSILFNQLVAGTRKEKKPTSSLLGWNSVVKSLDNLDWEFWSTVSITVDKHFIGTMMKIIDLESELIQKGIIAKHAFSIRRLQDFLTLPSSSSPFVSTTMPMSTTKIRSATHFTYDLGSQRGSSGGGDSFVVNNSSSNMLLQSLQGSLPIMAMYPSNLQRKLRGDGLLLVTGLSEGYGETFYFDIKEAWRKTHQADGKTVEEKIILLNSNGGRDGDKRKENKNSKNKRKDSNERNKDSKDEIQRTIISMNKIYSLLHSWATLGASFASFVQVLNLQNAKFWQSDGWQQKKKVTREKLVSSFRTETEILRQVLGTLKGKITLELVDTIAMQVQQEQEEGQQQQEQEQGTRTQIQSGHLEEKEELFETLDDSFQDSINEFHILKKYLPPQIFGNLSGKIDFIRYTRLSRCNLLLCLLDTFSSSTSGTPHSPLDPSIISYNLKQKEQRKSELREALETSILQIFVENHLCPSSHSVESNVIYMHLLEKQVLGISKTLLKVGEITIVEKARVFNSMYKILQALEHREVNTGLIRTSSSLRQQQQHQRNKSTFPFHHLEENQVGDTAESENKSLFVKEDLTNSIFRTIIGIMNLLLLAKTKKPESLESGRVEGKKCWRKLEKVLIGIDDYHSKNDNDNSSMNTRTKSYSVVKSMNIEKGLVTFLLKLMTESSHIVTDDFKFDHTDFQCIDRIWRDRKRAVSIKAFLSSTTAESVSGSSSSRVEDFPTVSNSSNALHHSFDKIVTASQRKKKLPAEAVQVGLSRTRIESINKENEITFLDPNSNSNRQSARSMKYRGEREGEGEAEEKSISRMAKHFRKTEMLDVYRNSPTVKGKGGRATAATANGDSSGKFEGKDMISHPLDGVHFEQMSLTSFSSVDGADGKYKSKYIHAFSERRRAYFCLQAILYFLYSCTTTMPDRLFNLSELLVKGKFLYHLLHIPLLAEMQHFIEKVESWDHLQYRGYYICNKEQHLEDNERLRLRSNGASNSSDSSTVAAFGAGGTGGVAGSVTKRNIPNTIKPSPYSLLWWKVVTIMRNIIFQLTLESDRRMIQNAHSHVGKLNINTSLLGGSRFCLWFEAASCLRSQDLFLGDRLLCRKNNSFCIESKDSPLLIRFYNEDKLSDLKDLVINSWACYRRSEFGFKIDSILDEGLQTCFDFVETYQRLLYAPLSFFYIHMDESGKEKIPRKTLTRQSLKECSQVVRFFQTLALHSSQWKVIQPTIYQDIRRMMKGIISCIAMLCNQEKKKNKSKNSLAQLDFDVFHTNLLHAMCPVSEEELEVDRLLQMTKIKATANTEEEGLYNSNDKGLKEQAIEIQLILNEILFAALSFLRRTSINIPSSLVFLSEADVAEGKVGFTVDTNVYFYFHDEELGWKLTFGTILSENKVAKYEEEEAILGTYNIKVYEEDGKEWRTENISCKEIVAYEDTSPVSATYARGKDHRKEKDEQDEENENYMNNNNNNGNNNNNDSYNGYNSYLGKSNNATSAEEQGLEKIVDKKFPLDLLETTRDIGLGLISDSLSHLSLKDIIVIANYTFSNLNLEQQSQQHQEQKKMESERESMKILLRDCNYILVSGIPPLYEKNKSLFKKNLPRDLFFSIILIFLKTSILHVEAMEDLVEAQKEETIQKIEKKIEYFEQESKNISYNVHPSSSSFSSSFQHQHQSYLETKWRNPQLPIATANRMQGQEYELSEKYELSEIEMYLEMTELWENVNTQRQQIILSRGNSSQNEKTNHYQQPSTYDGVLSSILVAYFQANQVPKFPTMVNILTIFIYFHKWDRAVDILNLICRLDILPAF